MTSVAPPSPPSPPSAVGNAAQLTVTLPQQTPAALTLSKLALDSLVNGLVKQTTPEGILHIKTDFGLLQFKAPFNLPEDTQTTFRLVQKTPVLQIQLVALNTKPVNPNMPATRLHAFASQPAAGGTQSGAATQTPAFLQGTLGNQGTNAPATLLNLNSATGLRAFVLTPAQTQSIQGTQTTQTTAGQSSPTATMTASAGPNTQKTTTQSTTTPTGQHIRSLIQPGHNLRVRLLSVNQTTQQGEHTSARSAQTPSVTTQNGVTKNSTVIIQGNVTGNTIQNQPIVRTPHGLIALETKAQMQEGAQVKLEILSASRPNPAASIEKPLPATQLEQGVGKNWPALEDTVKILNQSNPAVADALQHSMLPKADQRLAANMIFFLKALGRGNFKNWADDRVTKALSKARPELLKNLEMDFNQISTKAKTPNSTDWKIAYIPLQDNGQINQIRIAERDNKDEQKDGKEDPGVRFVIDLNLSRLGPLQLDGLTKQSNRMFDLIIRTKKPMAGFIRRDILDIYENAMDALGFNGRLSFQVTSTFVEVEGVDLTSQLNLGMLV
jgi:hypothetical protein